MEIREISSKQRLDFLDIDLRDELSSAAAAFLYLTHIHKVVMNSWRIFSESIQETAEENRRIHRARQIQHAQEDGSLREAEYRKLPCAFIRQASHFRMQDAPHPCRHLDFPA